MNTETMYATMPPWRLFWKVAMPGMVGMFAMSIYSIVEGIFIGQTLGEGAFAAVNIAMPLVMINFSLADLIGVGASAPISIALGRKDYREANNIFTCSVILIFLTAIVMSGIMFFAAVPLSRMMGADDVLLDTAVRYLRTVAVLGPLGTIFFAMDNFMRISGFVKTSMIINIFCNVLTIALLALFLLGFHMDVVGSALATSLAMCVSSVIAMIPFLRNKALLKFVRPRFQASMIRKIVACGSPTFLSNISGRVTSIAMNISLMTLGVRAMGQGGGTTAIAVYAILMYASDLCWPLMYGISDSLAPAIGYNWGAREYSRVKKIAACGFLGTAVAGIGSASVLFCFPETIASLFANAEDVRLLEMSAHAIRIFCFTYFFRWMAVMGQSFLSAVQKPAQAAVLSVGSAFVFPLLLLGALWNFGLDGIWFNNVGVNALAALSAVILLARLAKEIREKQRACR